MVSVLPSTLDLNLLRVLVQIYHDRKVSLAAEHLGLSQPAVSGALKKLRVITGDKLFIPTARGMRPTPLADLIAPALARSLGDIGEALAARVSFDPGTSRRRFTIAMTDIGEFHFLPRLMEALRDEAPGIAVATVRPTAVDLRFEMEQGKVDLALGDLPGLSIDIHRRTLFRQRYVCLFRRGHPMETSGAPLDTYLASEHAVVLSLGTGHGRVDGLIDATVPARKVSLRLPHFVALADVLQSSEFVATVPEVFALRSARYFDLSYRSHPVALPVIEISQFWHTTMHGDPANRWLRGLIDRLFRDSIVVGHVPPSGTSNAGNSP